MAMLWLWLKAVGKHWKREVLGGVLIGLLALFSELSGITVPPRIYEVCAVLLFFYAMFLAFGDQYQRADKLERGIEANRQKEQDAGSGILSGFFDPQRRGTRAMETLAEEMRYQRHRTENEYSERETVRLLASHERGNQLFQMKVATNPDLESWIAAFNFWRGELLQALHPIDRAVLSVPLSDSQRFAGHLGALNRVHGDAKGQILVDLEKLTKILDRRST
jgi:hypothetical protein